MSYIRATLGADPDPKDIPFGIGYTGYPTWLAWSKSVAAKGGRAAEMPGQAGKYAGLQAELYPAAVIASRRFGEPALWTAGKAFGYYVAPARILALDSLHQAQMKIAIAEGKAAGAAESLAKSLVGGAIATVAIGAGLLYLLTSSRSSS